MDEGVSLIEKLRTTKLELELYKRAFRMIQKDMSDQMSTICALKEDLRVLREEYERLLKHFKDTI